MENQETQVVEEITENTEQTAEQTPVMYSQEQVDEIVKQKLDEIMPGKIARKEAKIRKENDREYGELMGLLRAGTGKDSVQDITAYVREYYGSRGVTPQEAPAYSQEDLAVLANADVQGIIRGGYDEVVEEEQRLAKLGDRMTPREKAVHTALAQHRQLEEQGRELEKLGVSREEYTGKAFQDFAKQFTAGTPVTNIWNLYTATKPKKEIQTMGSVQTVDSGDGGIKEFYTPEEAAKITKEEYLRNPALRKAVDNSAQKWK